jgi:hypothetical protein
MIRAWWYRLARVWGWERADKPKPRAERMPRDWWRKPPAFDKAWRKNVVGRPF